MILAAGLTPAWQQMLVFDGLRVGEVNRAREALWCASGKVLNVGIALHHLGGPSRTIALIGGPSGDGIERGLLGLFIGVSLKDQFEFLMSDWANKGSFAPGLRDTRDPIIGNNSVSGATFLIPMPGQKRPLEVSGLSSFVITRGAAYCFLPSATAIRYISGLSPSPA